MEIVLVAMLDKLGFPDPLGRGEDVNERGESRGVELRLESREVELRLDLRLRLYERLSRGIVQRGELSSENKQRVQTAHFYVFQEFPRVAAV